jgi:thiamine-phosphate pyrophosphorylase
VCANARRAPLDVVRAFLSAGVTCLQLRAKTWESGPFFDLAAETMAAVQGSDVIVIINDRADIAALVRATGVHVGQHDLPPSDARRLVGREAAVGLSTHSEPQLEAGLTEPVSYLAVGPVFGTDTKTTGFDAIGLEAVRRAADLVGERMPLVAIGGISLSRAPLVIESGATSVAVISDLLVGDPEARARALVETLR